MTDPFDIETYAFDLPAERIAARPARPRDSARLLAVLGGRLEDAAVRDLPGFLRPGDLLVVNDTRVIPARLAGRRGAARVEATLVRALGPDRWLCLARPAKRLRPGERVDFAGGLSAEVAGKGGGGEVELRFDRSDAALEAAIAEAGTMPLPPYIPRPEGPDAADREDYQTLFAERPGAVAAPTAGLHFTPALTAALDAAGVGLARVTLHVGPGTFLPVKETDLRRHRMHAEWGEVPQATAEAVAAARARGGRVAAVGTTSLRLLESAATDEGLVRPFRGETDIFIMPGFRFRVADLLMTNFHLPRSTLFVLVCAFAGTDRMRQAYAHAVAAGYRFYSYGDACLLERA